MGNELVSQNMQNYGYNPAMYNTGMTIPMSMPMGLNTMPMMPVKDYSNDVFAPDFLKNPNSYNIWQGYNSQNYTQNTQNQSIFNTTENPIPAPQSQIQTFTGDETQSQAQNPEPAENENVYERTSTFKKLGATVGLSIPLLTSGYKILKGAKLSDALKYKELGIKGLAIGIAGWCAGAIIDGFINSNRAQTASNAA